MRALPIVKARHWGFIYILQIPIFATLYSMIPEGFSYSQSAVSGQVDRAIEKYERLIEEKALAILRSVSAQERYGAIISPSAEKFLGGRASRYAIDAELNFASDLPELNLTLVLDPERRIDRMREIRRAGETRDEITGDYLDRMSFSTIDQRLAGSVTLCHDMGLDRGAATADPIRNRLQPPPEIDASKVYTLRNFPYFRHVEGRGESGGNFTQDSNDRAVALEELHEKYSFPLGYDASAIRLLGQYESRLAPALYHPAFAPLFETRECISRTGIHGTYFLAHELVADLYFSREINEIQIARRGLIPSGAESIPVMVYFSIVTTTTLGYGDIVPIAPWAQGLAGFQAIFGLVIIGLFLNSIASRPTKEIA